MFSYKDYFVIFAGYEVKKSLCDFSVLKDDFCEKFEGYG